MSHSNDSMRSLPLRLTALLNGPRRVIRVDWVDIEQREPFFRKVHSSSVYRSDRPTAVVLLRNEKKRGKGNVHWRFRFLLIMFFFGSSDNKPLVSKKPCRPRWSLGEIESRDHQLVAPEIKTWLYCIDLATFIGLTLNPCLFSVKRIQPATNYNISSTSRIVFVFSSKCHVRIRNVWYKIKSKPLNRITAVRDRSGGQMPPFNWSSPAMRCSAIESPSTHTPQKKRKKLPTSRPRDRRRGRWAISSRPRRHWRPSERRKWWRPRRWWRRGW